MNNAVKIVKSKSRGDVGDIIGSALCIFFFLAIFSVSVHYVKILTAKQNVDALAREYILIEEQEGFLTTTDISDIQSSLNNMGFSNFTISCNGFGYPKASYGEKVNIDIVVNTNPHELQISNLFNVWNDGQIQITSNQESISKW